MRTAAVIAVLVLLAGCASWFQSRVEQIDAKIEALRADQSSAPAEEQQQIARAIEQLEAEKRQALEGAQSEQANKQAILMAILGIGAETLKVFGSMAKKGAGA